MQALQRSKLTTAGALIKRTDDETGQHLIASVPVRYCSQLLYTTAGKPCGVILFHLTRICGPKSFLFSNFESGTVVILTRLLKTHF